MFKLKVNIWEGVILVLWTVKSKTIRVFTTEMTWPVCRSGNFALDYGVHLELSPVAKNLVEWDLQPQHLINIIFRDCFPAATRGAGKSNHQIRWATLSSEKRKQTLKNGAKMEAHLPLFVALNRGRAGGLPTVYYESIWRDLFEIHRRPRRSISLSVGSAAASYTSAEAGLLKNNAAAMKNWEWS